MSKVILPLLVFALSCVSFTKPDIESVPESGVPDALAATAALVTESGRAYCGGVFVERWLVTAHHCVDDKESVLVALYGDFDDAFNALVSYPFAVVRRIDRQDLAVLSPNSVLPKGAGAAKLALEIPPLGSTVIAIGHPLGVPYTITTGVVSARRRVGTLTHPNQVWIQASINITYGNSGGPLFTRRGEVIGIASFMMTRGSEHHIAGFTHLEEIRKALQ